MCDYNQCHINNEYPALAWKLKLAGIEETVIMVTGVDPRAGVDPTTEPPQKTAATKIVFGERLNVCWMNRVSGTQFGSSFSGST